MVSSDRWVCRRCFADNEGVDTTCTRCGLARFVDGEAAQAGTSEPLSVPPPAGGPPAPPWQPLAAPAEPFWKKLVPFWWVGLIGVFIVAGVLFNARRDESGAITDGGTLQVNDLQVGDCFNADVSGDIDDVDAVPCTEPHAYELFHVFTMTDAGAYPSSAEFDTQSDAACSPAFTEYVGVAYSASELYASTLTPTEAVWNDGDHAVQCMLHEVDESQVSGSLRGAAR